MACENDKKKFIFKPHVRGFFKDGKAFEIIDFRNLVLSETGEILDGKIGVLISENNSFGNGGRYSIYPISVLAEETDCLQ